MRVSRLASLLALYAFLASPPLLAQAPADPPRSETGSDTAVGAEDPVEETEEGDDSDDGDRTDDDGAETETSEPPRKLSAEGDIEGETEPGPEEDEEDEKDEEADEEETVVVKKEVVTRTEVRAIDSSTVDSLWNAELDEFSQRYKWRLFIGGYLRAQYTGIQNDPANGLIGQNDGFILGNARLTLQGTMRDTLGFRFQVDGAVDRNNSTNSPDGEVVTRLRDAFIFWDPFSFLGIQFGQFKPRFDVEELFSTAEILFVDRSVGSRGLSGVEGFNQPGLSIQREVGVNIGSDGFFPFASGDEPESVGFSYGLALTNGADANRSLNDNDQLAYYGRLGLHWADLVRVGGAYYVNDTLAGEQPDVIEESRTGFTGDVTFTGFGVTAIASYIQTEIATPQVDGNTSETATTYQAQLAYREPYLGFQPAFRYAYYDPSDALDNDALTYYTVGLNYLPPYPVRLSANYTITQEEEGRQLENDRFDLMLQAQW